MHAPARGPPSHISYWKTGWNQLAILNLLTFFAFSLPPRLNKIGKQNPNLGPVADHGSDDDDGSPDMTAIVSALAQQQQRASVTILRKSSSVYAAGSILIPDTQFCHYLLCRHMFF